MECAVVLVADTPIETVVASITALAEAIDVLEEERHAVTTVIVDTSADPRVTGFLDRLEGARVLRLPGATRAQALIAGAEVARGEVVWLGVSDSAPRPSALSVLVDAVGRGLSMALAASSDPAPYAALAADALPLLEKLSLEATIDTDAVPELVTRCLRADLAVARVAGAGCVSARSRTPRDIGASMQVVPGKFTAGPGSYSSPSTLIKSYAPLDEIEVGAYCSIADEARIILPGGRVFAADGREIPLVQRGVHRMRSASTFPIGILVPDVPYDDPPDGAVGERLVVGDDVWIGYGARIMGNVVIGTGAVIGAGALVVRDVPPYTVVGGVPARVLRPRFDDATVQRLLAVSWWNWLQPFVTGAHQWFRRDVADFLRHFDPAGES